MGGSLLSDNSCVVRPLVDMLWLIETPLSLIIPRVLMVVETPGFIMCNDLAVMVAASIVSCEICDSFSVNVLLTGLKLWLKPVTSDDWLLMVTLSLE